MNRILVSLNCGIIPVEGSNSNACLPIALAGTVACGYAKSRRERLPEGLSCKAWLFPTNLDVTVYHGIAGTVCKLCISQFRIVIEWLYNVIGLRMYFVQVHYEPCFIFNIRLSTIWISLSHPIYLLLINGEY